MKDITNVAAKPAAVRWVRLCTMIVGWMWSPTTRKYKMKVVKSLDRPREIAGVINNALVWSRKPLERITGFVRVF